MKIRPRHCGANNEIVGHGRLPTDSKVILGMPIGVNSCNPWLKTTLTSCAGWRLR